MWWHDYNNASMTDPFDFLHAPGSSVSFATTPVTTRSYSSTISCPTPTTGPSSVTTVNTPPLKKSFWSPTWPSNTQVSAFEYLFSVHFLNEKELTMLRYKSLQARSLSPAKCVTSWRSIGRTCVFTFSVVTLRRLKTGLWLTLRSRWRDDAGHSSRCSR